MRLRPAVLALLVVAAPGRADADVAQRLTSATPQSHAALDGTSAAAPGRGRNLTAGRRGQKGVVLAVRAGETFRIRVSDARDHVSDSALKAFRNLMRQGPNS